MTKKKQPNGDIGHFISIFKSIFLIATNLLRPNLRRILSIIHRIFRIENHEVWKHIFLSQHQKRGIFNRWMVFYDFSISAAFALLSNRVRLVDAIFSFLAHICIILRSSTVYETHRTHGFDSIQFDTISVQCDAMQINRKSELELNEQGWSFQGQGHPHRRNTIDKYSNEFSVDAFFKYWKCFNWNRNARKKTAEEKKQRLPTE